MAKQNTVKKMLKYPFCKRLSKNTILISTICKLLYITNVVKIRIWITILICGLWIIFLSEKRPRHNIKKPKIFKLIKLLDTKIDIQQNKKIPPIKTGELSILIIFLCGDDKALSLRILNFLKTNKKKTNKEVVKTIWLINIKYFYIL